VQSLADEEPDSPSTVRPRATDFLSAAVETRARAASAIVSGQEVAAAVGNPFKMPLPPRPSPTMAMEGDDEGGLKLRPTKGPVQPMAKADLLPGLKISAEQEQILSRMAPPKMSAPEPKVEAPPPAPTGARRTRAVEMPEPGERPKPRREFYAAEWDRYYNPGIFAAAKIPKMQIEQRGAQPGAPAWTIIGKPKGAGVVATSQAPYRASLQEGARVKDSKPQKEVAKFLAHRGEPGEIDLDGPAEVPDGADAPHGGPDATRRAQFEAALADLERSFEESRAGPPARSAPAPAAPPPRAAAPPPGRQANAASLVDRAVSKAAEMAMPYPQTSTSAPPRALSRSSRDMADEDDADADAEDEEEPTLGRQPPADHRAEEAAHRTLQHDGSGAALCPTCGRRINAQNPVMVCTSCSRVACGTCGKFSAGAVSGNVYQYEYRFNFPLCQPCFERHFSIQKNLARGRAYLASGNLTYAFYHAQSARQLEDESPYKADVDGLIKQVEDRRGQMQKAEKEWDNARRKIMKERTTVLK
jgi:hypothetical protein